METENWHPDYMGGVRKFVKTIWFHELVNERTLNARSEAISIFNDFINKYPYLKSEMVGMLIGSVLWVVADETSPEESDYDLLLMARDYDVLKELSEKVKLEPKGTFKDFNFITGEKFGPLFFLPEKLGDVGSYDLLLTPDEYVVGDLPKAHALRMQMLKDLHEQPVEKQKKIWDEFTAYFKKRYVGWKDQEDWKINERSRRFNEALENRAEKSRSPDKYKKQFMSAMSNLSLPDFNVYYDAIKETNGIITL